MQYCYSAFHSLQIVDLHLPSNGVTNTSEELPDCVVSVSSHLHKVVQSFLQLYRVSTYTYPWHVAFVHSMNCCSFDVIKFSDVLDQNPDVRVWSSNHMVYPK